MKRFQTSVAATALFLTLAILCLALGGWQLRKSAHKAELEAQFESAARLSSLPVEPLLYTRVSLSGALDPQRHFLVDNQVEAGRAGVHVLTPFRDAGSGQLVLVNRGWLGMAPERTQLPEVATSDGTINLSGHLEALRRPGRQLGSDDAPAVGGWPRLLTYPDFTAIESALGEPLYPFVLYLDTDSLGGFAGRDWQPVYLTAARHRAYAVQWFALAVVAASAWLALGISAGKAESELPK